MYTSQETMPCCRRSKVHFVVRAEIAKAHFCELFAEVATKPFSEASPRMTKLSSGKRGLFHERTRRDFLVNGMSNTYRSEKFKGLSIRNSIAHRTRNG